MAELTIPLARRSGAVGTRHLVAGVMARGVERDFSGLRRANGGASHHRPAACA